MDSDWTSTIVTALAGIVGAVVGGLLTGWIQQRNEMLRDRRRVIGEVRRTLYLWHRDLWSFKYVRQRGDHESHPLNKDINREGDYQLALNMAKHWFTEDQWKTLHDALVMFRRTTFALWNQTPLGQEHAIAITDKDGNQTILQNVNWDEYQSTYERANKILDELSRNNRL